MLTSEEINNNVIKIYLEVYLRALNEERPAKFINIIKSRLQELLQYKLR
tara:strand:+ start:93 stop:239 length:147 start_codon:yes stop_codon:yes gene_type:complete